MSGKVILRIGLVLLAVGVLAWLIFRGEEPKQFDVIEEGSLYRAVVTNVDEFAAAELKTEPGTICTLLPAGVVKTEPWSTMTSYAFRNKIRVTPMVVPEQGSLSMAQIAEDIAQISSARYRPVLLIGPEGLNSGKIAVAYRLAVKKMPLAEVERLAALPDAPAETTRELQAFARSYDQAMRELANKATPATQDAPPALPK